jgi:hypothetical protein
VNGLRRTMTGSIGWGLTTFGSILRRMTFGSILRWMTIGSILRRMTIEVEMSCRPWVRPAPD